MSVEKVSRQPAVWDFRANEDYFTSAKLVEFFKENATLYSFQKEKGDSGYIHWQGRFRLIKKRAKAGLVKLFESAGLKEPNYLQPTLKANHDQKFFYATKADTRIEGPWTDTTEPTFIPIQYSEKYIPKLYPYQEQILESGKQLELRKINLIYDKTGNNGKSTVSAIGELKYDFIDMPPLNDYKELVQLLHSILSSTNNRHPGLIFIDMPRAIGKERLFGLYSAIEQIKKGKVYDIRYKYAKWWFDVPQIWVFSNSLPNMEWLSPDRWNIWAVTEDRRLVPYGDDEEKEEPEEKIPDEFLADSDNF